MKDIHSVEHYRQQLANYMSRTKCYGYLESYVIGAIQSLAEDGNNKAILNLIKAYDETNKSN